METAVLVQTGEMGRLKKTVLLLKMRHIQLNYKLFGIMKHFCGDCKKYIFKDENVTSQRKARIPHREYFFIEFEKWYILKILSWYKRLFLFKPVK